MKLRVGPMLPQLSVVVAVRDVEETVGRDVRRLALHLRAQGLSFEIVAVNDGSRDTSLALLRLVAAELPELRIVTGDASGRAFRRGFIEARGQALALWEAHRGPFPLAAVAWALSRLAAGKHAVVLRGRCVIGDRLACASVVSRLTGRGDLLERSFERHAAGLDLAVVGARTGDFWTGGLLAPVLRFLAA